MQPDKEPHVAREPRVGHPWPDVAICQLFVNSMPLHMLPFQTYTVHEESAFVGSGRSDEHRDEKKDGGGFHQCRARMYGGLNEQGSVFPQWPLAASKGSTHASKALYSVLNLHGMRVFWNARKQLFSDQVDKKVAFFAEKREESGTGPWFGANRLLSWPRWLLPVPGLLLVAILPLFVSLRFKHLKRQFYWNVFSLLCFVITVV